MIFKKAITTILLLGFVSPAFSCLIVVITDSEKVLVGNHEDWYARDARIVFNPAEEGKFGHVLFDFASEGYAQGGMNSEGLFFDGTATPYVPIEFPDKIVYDGYIWKAVLEKCATVEEAIEFVKDYQLPEMEEVHILFADKSGKSVVMGAYDGQLTFHARKNNFHLLTNFNLTDPAYGGEVPCPRYGKALEILTTDSTATVENVRNILSQTHQEELSVYSNIYDLTNGDVYVYQLANFQSVVRFNLFEELQRGEHSFIIPELFGD